MEKVADKSESRKKRITQISIGEPASNKLLDDESSLITRFVKTTVLFNFKLNGKLLL